MNVKVEIYRTCPFCRTHRANTYDWEQYKAWRSGTLIQDAFPNSTDDEREFLITGICAKCWDNITDL